jgi:hypothetical protein
MAYTAPTSKALRTRKGRIDEKIATELGLIDAEMAAIQGGTLTIANTKIMVGNAQGVGAAVNVSGDATLANTGEITIAAEAVTLAKMADLARGSLIVGATAGNRPTALDANDAGKILVGDGNDLVSVAMFGDATLATTGALTVADNAITNAKIAPAFLQRAKVALTPGVADAFAFSFQNPEATKIIVFKGMIRITAGGGTPLAVMDVGTGDEATSANNNLWNDLDITAPGVFQTTCDKIFVLDENGGTTDFINGQIKTQNAAALAGDAYFWYTAI